MMNLINRTNMVSEEGKMALGCFLEECYEECIGISVNGEEIDYEEAIKLIDKVEAFVSDNEESCTVIIAAEEIEFLMMY